MGLVFDIGIPGVFLVVGMCMIVGAFQEVRRMAIPRCFKCRYSLRGVEGLVCPECGYKHADTREKLHGRVRRGMAAGGVALVAVSAVPLVIWTQQAWAIGQTKVALDAIDPQVAPVFKTSGSLEVRLPAYSWGTRWVARQMGQADDPQSLDKLVETYRKGANWAFMSDGVIYVGSWLLSPSRHYGLYSKEVVHCEYDLSYEGPEVADRSLEEALAKVTQGRVVTRLTFSNRATLNDASMARIAGQQALNSLRVERADVSAGALAPVAQAGGMRDLHMRFVKPVTDAHVAPLVTSPWLQSLSLEGPAGSRITPKGLAGLKSQALSSVWLKVPYWVGNDPAPLDCFLRVNHQLALTLPDIDHVRLSALGKVQVMYQMDLDLRGNEGLGSGALDWLDQVKSPPIRLRIRGNGRMDVGAVTRLIGRFPSANQAPAANTQGTNATRPARYYYSVSLEGFKLDRAFFEAVKVSNLSRLGLAGCVFEQGDFEGLRGAQLLESLHIQGLSLDAQEMSVITSLKGVGSLELRDIPVTDADLRGIGAMPELCYLELSQVTDASLKALGRGRGLSVQCAKDHTTVLGRRVAPRVDLHVIEETGGEREF